MMKKFNRKYSARASASLPSMSVIGTAQPDVVRIKVYKPNSNTNDETAEAGFSKKFCVDPRLTSYRTLQCLIAQAFDIKTDFTISAISKCPTTGREHYTAIWSDWDLDASIQSIQPGSYLRLRYELASREEGLDDWDFVGLNDYNANIRWFNVDSRSIIATVNQTAGKAASALNKAINWMYGGNERRTGRPVGENDLKKFLDADARLVHVNELRQAIYEGGVEPSFRKVVWRHLLNIFPANLSGVERIHYLKYVTLKYETLKKRWMSEKYQTEHIRLIMRTIHKDVLRTDRDSGFYADSRDSNVQSLFHILTTYCVSHPSVTYCQGMNDYASTLLYVMREESLAYVCFCAIMRRIRANFTTDGVAIATKLLHLKVLLQAIDPVYWNFFESCDAVSLYFTYRWLLLECKREFPFNDALRVLEVMWATLPIENEPPALSELVLLSSPSDTMIVDGFSNSPDPPAARHRAHSCPQFSVLDDLTGRKLKHRSSSLPYTSNGQLLTSLQKQERSRHRHSSIDHDDYSLERMKNSSSSSDSTHSRTRGKSLGNSFSLSEISEFDSDYFASNTMNHHTTTSTTSVSHFLVTTDWLQRLPAGDSLLINEENSFLLFLCVAILIAHRHSLLKQKNLDEQEISMYFGRFRRRHNGERILHCARALYAQYIQWARKKRVIEDINRFSES